MDSGNYNSQHVARTAEADFERARRKAFLNSLAARFNRRPNWLLSFEEVQRLLGAEGQQYRGYQEVPVSAIVGSVDRYHDFNRGFLPIQDHTRPRWESVDRATLADVSLPPVQLYKVGYVYFVKDGNHRVSVAKEKGAEYIDAEVIERPISVPLSPDTDPRDLLRLGEYARFLEQTKLDVLRSDVWIEFTTLGRYDTLLEHISAHRWYMGIDQNRPVEWEEAVLDWYDNVYLPIVRVIEESNVLQDFPGRTPADLYLWVMDYIWHVREQSGDAVEPHEALLVYDARHISWTRKVVRSLRRLRQAATAPFVVSAQHVARALKASRNEDLG